MKQVYSRAAKKGRIHLIYSPHTYISICRCRSPETDYHVGVYDDVVPYILLDYNKESSNIFVDISEGAITHVSEYDDDLIFELSDDEVLKHVISESV